MFELMVAVVASVVGLVIITSILYKIVKIWGYFRPDSGPLV
jgi:hypothetical protein